MKAGMVGKEGWEEKSWQMYSYGIHKVLYSTYCTMVPGGDRRHAALVSGSIDSPHSARQQQSKNTLNPHRQNSLLYAY